MANIPQTDIHSLIKGIENVDHDDFSIETSNNVSGEGFIGEIIFVSCTNNRTREKKHFVIKQPKTVDDKEFLEWAKKPIDNEVFFYDKIWPTLNKLYHGKSGNFLDFIPKCVALSKDDRRIVMEDLKLAGFKLKNISSAFTREEFTRIFTQYGIFHGVSMALKEQNHEEFLRLVQGIDVVEIFTEKEFYTNNLIRTIKEVKTFFNEETEKHLLEKLEEYDVNGQALIHYALYGDKVSRTIIHNDCWSNNFMFNYKDGKQLQDIKIIDFQLICAGSPVHDLAYLLYSSGVGQDYHDLNYYLKVYHSSLSGTLKYFDLDIDKIYSFDTLKTEWKKYSRYGFAMGVLGWKVKTSDTGELKEILNFDDLQQISAGTEIYKQRMRDLVFHFYNNDFL